MVMVCLTFDDPRSWTFSPANSNQWIEPPPAATMDWTAGMSCGRFRLPFNEMTTLERFVALIGVNTLYSTPSRNSMTASLEQSANAFAIAGESEAVPLEHLYLDGTTHVFNAKLLEQSEDSRRKGVSVLENMLPTDQQSQSSGKK